MLTELSADLAKSYFMKVCLCPARIMVFWRRDGPLHLSVTKMEANVRWLFDEEYSKSKSVRLWRNLMTELNSD